ncbi:MAG: hypothetical protein V7603_3705 [Micromonosporaceae bacterium]
MIRRIMTPGAATISAALLTITLIATAGDVAWAGPAQTARSTTSVNRFCPPLTAFDASSFPQSTRIDSRIFPLEPGTQFVYEGRSNTGGGPLPHRVVFTVTDMIKIIDGVRTRVLWDQDLNEGQLAESELAFHAQDRHDNVWVLGEYPEEYDDNGNFTGAPNTWITGVAGAKGGVLAPGSPRLGTPRFLEGSSPGIDFLDCGQVFALNQQTCVPTGCYQGVMVIDENSPLDPASGHQRKYYAPGVGVVRIGAVGDPEGETLVLVAVNHLGPGAMAEVRATVRKLERRAYQVSAVYRHTPPARVAR